MAKLGTTIILAGALTASANQAFADNRPARPHPAHNAAIATNPADRPITGITKDGKPVQIEMSVPVLNKGNYTDDGFQRALKGGEMMAALQTFSQYTEAEIPGNIGKIQQQITEKIGPMIPMNGGGSAKPGVNYGNATVTKITEVIGGKPVFQQAAPKGSAPKAPGS